MKNLLSAVVLGCFAVLGCSEPNVRWVLYDDLLVDGAPICDGKPLDLDDRACGDETWFGVAVESGCPVELDLDWERDAELVLSGYLECPTDDEVAARLGWRFAGETGENGGDIVLASEVGWWRRELDVGLPSTSGVLTVDAQLPDECSLVIRDAMVRKVFVERPRDEDLPQILLISIDTLRADVLSDHAVLVPNLRSLIAEGEFWSNHYAGSSWTLPSHATMLTGYPTWVHGAVNAESAIDPRVPTLAERLSEAGFDTGALVYDARWLDADYGFARGFMTYRMERWRIDRQVRTVMSWIHGHRDRPFFFFFHSFEPHSDFRRLPYEAPGVSRASIEDDFGIRAYGCRKGACASKFLARLGRGEVPRREHDRRVLRHLYDAGVAHTDEVLGVLIDGLRGAGIWDELLVVVTSDHGEEFFEHGGTLHSTLFEEIVRVPLIVKWPGGQRAGIRHHEPTSSIDLAPTLLGFAGLTAEDLPGTELQPAHADRAVFAADLATTVIDGSFKGVFGGAKHLDLVFDLERDPGESENLSGTRPELRQHLLDLAVRRVKSDRERYGVSEPLPKTRPELKLSVEELDRLEALGYVN